jgi:hypothetical protein
LGHPAALAPDRLLAECDIRFLRRSGPGGQNRNKVETAVVLHHRPTGLTAEANEARSQAHNRDEAIFRLRINLALDVRAAVALGASPSELWRSRCHGGRIHVNPRHDDFPTLLADALDALEAFHLDVKPAAEWLGCSSSQLIKFLKDEPRAFQRLNTRRKERGLRTLL